MARRKDQLWGIPEFDVDYHQASLAVLMDLRDELKEIKQLLRCFRIQKMFTDVSQINRRLKKRIKL